MVNRRVEKLVLYMHQVPNEKQRVPAGCSIIFGGRGDSCDLRQLGRSVLEGEELRFRSHQYHQHANP
jgi:hypothetical protein